MQKFRYLYIKKKYRWLVFPLIIALLTLAYAGKFFDFSPEDERDAMQRINATGQLTALTDRNSIDYFIYNGEPMGYQYELLRSFADYLGVHLKIISSNDISNLRYYLDLNLGDLIAADIPVTKEGKRLGKYSHEMNKSGQVLVQRKKAGKNGSKLIRDFGDFAGDSVYMQDNPFLLPYLEHHLDRKNADVVIVTAPNNEEELVKMVAEGKIKYAVCDDNLAEVIKSSYLGLDLSFQLTEELPTGWIVKSSSDTLRQKLNEWITKIRENGKYKKIYIQYFDNQRVAGFFRRDYFSVTDVKLSPYDKQIRDYSRMLFWDWRLVASLIYEESNFRTGLVSQRNASGLMQLMPETAALLGVDSTSSASQQIYAGIKYLKWLDSQLPPEIVDKKERINFILASYNVGIGKVLEARKIAEKNGRDPNKWDGNVDYYLTSKARKKQIPGDDHNDLSPYGLTGGFVARIMERYHHYRNNIPE